MPEHVVESFFEGPVFSGDALESEGDVVSSFEEPASSDEALELPRSWDVVEQPNTPTAANIK